MISRSIKRPGNSLQFVNSTAAVCHSGILVVHCTEFIEKSIKLESFKVYNECQLSDTKL